MRPFWALFTKILVKMNFPEKNGSQFLNIPIIYDGAKNEKELTTHVLIGSILKHCKVSKKYDQDCSSALHLEGGG